MPDNVTAATRSRMMSNIRGKDTKPEIAVRRFLHARGFRFRLHEVGLPGTPDIVLARYRAVVFVHGCFWHRHANCRFAYAPKSRQQFWETKLWGNVERDTRDQLRLSAAGWRVFVVWECQVAADHLEEVVRAIPLGGTAHRIRRRYGPAWSRDAAH